MLTAKGDEGSRIQGLELGADDYLAKPFNARTAGADRPCAPPAPLVPGAPAGRRVVTFGDQLFLATRELKKGDEVHADHRRFAVLKTLVQHAREPLTRDKLMNLARGREWDAPGAFHRRADLAPAPADRAGPVKPRYIQTVWGVGCVFVPDGAQGLSLPRGRCSDAPAASSSRNRRRPVRRRATVRSMKTPLWFPQSARTLWLVLIVVLFSKALTLVYLLMNEDVIVDRQYSHGAALTIRAFWAADEESRAAIAKASGLRCRAAPTSPASSTGRTRKSSSGRCRWSWGRIPRPACVSTSRRSSGCAREPRRRLAGGAAVSASLAWPTDLGVLGWFLGIGRPPPPGSSSASSASRSSAWWSPHASSARGAACACRWDRRRRVKWPRCIAPSTRWPRTSSRAGERELMLAGVSRPAHPLTRLRLSLELLPESEREMVEDMIRDIEDMDAILDQFLAFIRDGRDEPVEEGDLTDLVREVVAPFNQTREQVRMALQPVPAMPLRRVSMKRLLGNLIDNALNHGGGSVEVASYVAGESAAPTWC